MCFVYAISFVFSLFGFFGVGHLIAGAPVKAVKYLIAGLIWSAIAGAIGFALIPSLLCVVPAHLLFAHFCASDAVRSAKGPG